MPHLTEEERNRLERYLNKDLSFRSIAESIGKNPSTISREVQKHRISSRKTSGSCVLNNCQHRFKCKIEGLCKKFQTSCSGKCCTCRQVSCNELCRMFSTEKCPRLVNAPYVCNGCRRERQCSLTKYYYVAGIAQNGYRKTLKESREGVNMTEDELYEISDVVYYGTRKGQSIHHIMKTNQDVFTVCEKTVYNLVQARAIRTKRHDLPMACRRKKRKSKAVEHKVDQKCRVGRSFDDFRAFLKANPDVPVVEMDSVIGIPGQKVLLTMNFNSCSFMLAFLRPSNNAASVIDVFNALEQTLGLDTFRKMFPVILTDNGSEFSNPAALEFSPATKERRTRIYYCNPYSSWEKPHVENNHLNLRKLLPKGTSFNSLSQDNINLIVSHLNCQVRKSLNDKTPFELFELIYGKEVLKKLNIKAVPPQDVELTPSLPLYLPSDMYFLMHSFWCCV